MTVNSYEFRVYGAATSGVEFTAGSSNLRSAPTVRRQVVDVLTGRTQSRPWNVDVNDDGDFFSSKIADSGGRIALLGRKCDLRLAKDGGSFSVIGTGRITDMVDHVSHYSVNIQDERWRERTATVFTKQNVAPGSGSSSQYSGSVLMPAGLVGSYREFLTRPQLGIGTEISSTDGKYAWIIINFGDRDEFSNWNEKLLNLLIEDVKTDPVIDTGSTVGNFNHLRANVDGTDFEVAGFDARFDSETIIDAKVVPTVTFDLDGRSNWPGVWVVDSAGALTKGDTVRTFLHMPTAEPNRWMPLHIGGRLGIRPGQVLKDLYQDQGIAFSSNGMQDMIDDNELGVAWWRITGPELLGPWTEDHIYGPYGYMPLVTSSGAILPKKIHLPQDIDVGTLFEFTASRVSEEPSWFQTSRERVTAIRYVYSHEKPIHRRPFSGDWAADLIEVSDRTIERTHDRLDSGLAPRREITYKLDGVHSVLPVSFPGTIAQGGQSVWNPSRFVDTMARERFERFGDGPITGDVIALSTGEDVNQGDFVKIALATFPSPQTQSRGATRIVQIMSRLDGPAGPEFEWLDAGPSLNKLVAPTVTLAQSTGEPKHAVVATISGTSSGAGYQLQWGSGSTEPGSTSWRDWAGQGDSTGTNTIRPLPSGQIIWVRGRATAPNRIRSAWSTAPNTTTEEILPPTGLASSSIDGSRVTLDWSLGSSDSQNYALEVRATTGACPNAGLTSLVRLPIKSTKVTAEGMTQNTTHCFGVRHYDIYGGVSSEATLTVQMTDTPPVAPDVDGVETIGGSDDTDIVFD